MSEYLRPDVYIVRQNTGAEPIQTQGTAMAGFVGASRRGVFGSPVLVTSWSDFVTKFSRGLDTPFMGDSDLAYAVYGYFQNGGGRAYVVRTAHSTKAKAAVKIPTITGIDFTAKEEGVWGNDVAIAITANDTLFDITVTLDGAEVEKFLAMDNDTTKLDSYYYEVVNAQSNYITVSAGTLVLGTGTLTNGADGVSDLADEDFLGAGGIEALKSVSGVSLVAVPGQTSEAMLQGIMDFCAEVGNCFGILDLPSGLDVAGAILAKAGIGGSYGAVYFPWGKVSDPLVQGKLRLVPPSGHIAGIYARTDKERGVFKAPAGTEAGVRGFVDVETRLSNGDLEVLNAKSVNAIVTKANRGIVVWGARMNAGDKDRFYVSDIRLDIMVEESLYDGTQWSVFEPNDEKLWGALTAQVKAFLYNLWIEGALAGVTPAEAYFVKCDGELNTAEVKSAGKVIIEVGYAKKKPAEFTIIKITQKATV